MINITELLRLEGIIPESKLDYLDEYLIESNGITLTEVKILGRLVIREFDAEKAALAAKRTNKLAKIDKEEELATRGVKDAKKLAKMDKHFAAKRKTVVDTYEKLKAITLKDKKSIMDKLRLSANKLKDTASDAVHSGGTSIKDTANSAVTKGSKLIPKSTLGKVGVGGLAVAGIGAGSYAAYRSHKKKVAARAAA